MVRCPDTRKDVADCDCGQTHICPTCGKRFGSDGVCCDPYDTWQHVAKIDTLIARRAAFVYEGARLAAIAANAPIVPEPWCEREDDFRLQFLDVIERQCGPLRSESPEELHGSWMQAYFTNGWVYGEIRDTDARTHPDLVPYAQLGQLEQDKDSVFVALCDIARLWIRDPAADILRDTSDIALAVVPDITLVVRYGVWPANEVKEMLALGEIRKVMLNDMVYGYLAVPVVPSNGGNHA